PSDDSEEELSWNSSDDEDVDEQTKEEEESFDPIPRTPEGSEDEGIDEEDQELRLVRKQGYKKKKRQMKCIVTSISTREGVYK
nr:hypothetical protein [Tanacetum cinerariifolium]